MKEETGNLWDNWQAGQKVVVTTNIGWDPDHSNANNMGAGMALQAMQMWGWLPYWYGEHARVMADTKTPRVIEFGPLGLIFLPVKPLLDPENPEISWNQNADFGLIEDMLGQLRSIEGQISLGLPGCGNGGLDSGEMLAHMRMVLDDRFTLRDIALPAARIKAKSA